MKWGKPEPQDGATSGGAPLAGEIQVSQPIETILMATDLSARSDRATERAVALAAQHKALLHIVHIIDRDLPASVTEQVTAAAEAEIASSLEKLPESGDTRIEILVRRGSDYRDIIEEADVRDADLVILGTHRNESGNRPISGTTMERVIRDGRHPVLVVPDRVDGSYERVVIGVDFSVFSRFAIRSALAIAPKAEFHVVHAFQVPFAGFQGGHQTRRAVEREHELELTRIIDEEMNSLVTSSTQDEKRAANLQKVIRHGDPRSVLRTEVDRLQPDLLVLGTHGRVGISHALLGSVAKDFLNRPPCDVLAVKAW